MQSLLSLNEIKSAEKFTIENLGIPELDLMEFAARAAYRSLTSRAEFLSGRRGVILVGAGNNGGDAAALARILSEQSSGPVNFCIALLPSTKRSAALLFQLERLQSLDVPRLSLRPKM
jgi:NAD(P)H-hydrate repair Nnr-like enzyme with NAD(P)H-hydrate epimerase domain